MTGDAPREFRLWRRVGVVALIALASAGLGFAAVTLALDAVMASMNPLGPDPAASLERIVWIWIAFLAWSMIVPIVAFVLIVVRPASRILRDETTRSAS